MKVISVSCTAALFFATFNAAELESMAVIEAKGKCFFSAMAIHPLPVPKGAEAGFFQNWPGKKKTVPIYLVQTAKTKAVRHKTANDYQPDRHSVFWRPRRLVPKRPSNEGMLRRLLHGHRCLIIKLSYSVG